MPIHGEMVETCSACTRSTNSRCTVMFLVEFRVDEASTTTDWQVYGPPWEVRRWSNVRLRFVMLPALTGRPTEMPPTLVTTAPLGSIHCTTGQMLTSTVQVRLNGSPANPVPDSEMVKMCRRSREEMEDKQFMKEHQGHLIELKRVISHINSRRVLPTTVMFSISVPFVLATMKADDTAGLATALQV